MPSPHRNFVKVNIYMWNTKVPYKQPVKEFIKIVKCLTLQWEASSSLP